MSSRAERIAEAIAYARKRLDGFAASPSKHRQYAAKVLLKFKLLEVQQIERDDRGHEISIEDDMTSDVTPNFFANSPGFDLGIGTDCMDEIIWCSTGDNPSAFSRADGNYVVEVASSAPTPQNDRRQLVDGQRPLRLRRDKPFGAKGRRKAEGHKLGAHGLLGPRLAQHKDKGRADGLSHQNGVDDGAAAVNAATTQRRLSDDSATTQRRARCGERRSSQRCRDVSDRATIGAGG
jgi:hypothetical protein